jgi:hypothetical protein
MHLEPLVHLPLEAGSTANSTWSTISQVSGGHTGTDEHCSPTHALASRLARPMCLGDLRQR